MYPTQSAMNLIWTRLGLYIVFHTSLPGEQKIKLCNYNLGHEAGARFKPSIIVFSFFRQRTPQPYCDCTPCHRHNIHLISSALSIHDTRHKHAMDES
jgi:hypothetical protein